MWEVVWLFLLFFGFEPLKCSTFSLKFVVWPSKSDIANCHIFFGPKKPSRSVVLKVTGCAVTVGLPRIPMTWRSKHHGPMWIRLAACSSAELAPVWSDFSRDRRNWFPMNSAFSDLKFSKVVWLTFEEYSKTFQLDSLRSLTSSFPHVVLRNGPHVHPFAALSGAYYVHCGHLDGSLGPWKEMFLRLFITSSYITWCSSLEQYKVFANINVFATTVFDDLRQQRHLAFALCHQFDGSETLSSYGSSACRGSWVLSEGFWQLGFHQVRDALDFGIVANSPMTAIFGSKDWTVTGILKWQNRSWCRGLDSLALARDGLDLSFLVGSLGAVAQQRYNYSGRQQRTGRSRPEDGGGFVMLRIDHSSGEREFSLPWDLGGQLCNWPADAWRFQTQPKIHGTLQTLTRQMRWV